MNDLISRPDTLRINAWDGQASPADSLPERTPWAQRKLGERTARWLAPAAPADERDWKHPDVGWGVVLPDNDDLSFTERANGDDVPELAPLLAARGDAPVLRWRKELQQGYLRRYDRNGTAQDLSAQAPNPGVGQGRIPQYLLIVASPSQIPWAVQYALNMSTFVGRLDLDPPGLKNYVSALLNDWDGQITKPRAPVIWSVDHGQPDITWLMSRAIAAQLWQCFATDKDKSFPDGVRLDGNEATATALAAALTSHSPSLIVTTSHGMTGPLDNPNSLKRQIGMPVDAGYNVVDLAALGSWKPSGAIWYAHACCSAGSAAQSRYQDLLTDTAPVGRLLRGIAASAGAMTAPLAKALLGADQPLRAFVGHVEPTFDWTLRDPQTNQVITHIISKSLYNNLYQQDKRTPIGFALQGVYKEAGAFFGAWEDAVQGINQNIAGMRDWALYRQLVAADRQTLVILGDPTVALPKLN